MKYLQREESFICIGFEPVKLRYPVYGNNIKIYRYSSNGINDYVIGKDFEISDGKIIRTIGSSFPDYRNSDFYNVSSFDHEGLTKYGNTDFMMFADYTSVIEEEQTSDYQAKLISKGNGNFGALSSIFGKFSKKNFELLIFGDSISAGGGATSDAKAYYSLFADEIRKRYDIEVNITNKAIGGESSIDGIRRYIDVIKPSYDLMILAYGMNDQVVNSDGKQYFFPQDYKSNLRVFIEYANEMNVPVVLISPCLSNPRWVHTSKIFMQFVEQVRELSKEYGIPYADVTSLWQNELKYKTYSDLLDNDINHPTNYGHYLYFISLVALLG